LPAAGGRFGSRTPTRALSASAAALASGEPTLLDVVTELEAYPPITMFEGRLGR
jgi:hypothetical protein